ncbi:MAG: HIT family protein [Alphaproteobacteria bacterium]|nr:HIT family protein [Alphaproteobacteria bacterium]
MPSFVLHEKLAADTSTVGRLKLSRCLLMNDRTYPWLILVPERADIREIHQLARDDRNLLMDEIVRAQQALEQLYKPDKLNVAALGNAVPQLHVHVIARFKSDPAGMRPVWGVVPVQQYPAEMLTETQGRIADALARSGPFTSA